MLRDHADGLIVGSALVRILEQASKKPLAKVIEEIGASVEVLVQTLDRIE